MKHLILLVTSTFALTLSGALASGDESFNYDDQEDWGGTCKENEGRQSPIDIPTPAILHNTEETLRLPESCRSVTLKPVDDNTTIKFKFPEGVEMENVPILDKNVTLVELHFHWGGSEHLVDGVRYDMECHLVTTYMEEETPRIAVFARLFKAGEASPAVEQLISSHKLEVKGFNALSLYPDTIDHVFIYAGSLTTPPCTEGVFWMVVGDHLEVSQDQLERLKKLPIADGVMEQNWRKAQPVNTRNIAYYRLSSASTFTLNLSLILAVVMRFW